MRLERIALQVFFYGLRLIICICEVLLQLVKVSINGLDGLGGQLIKILVVRKIVDKKL